MGIFDIIELRNHISAIKDYVLYMDSLQSRDCQLCTKEFPQTLNLIVEHCKLSLKVLERMEK